MSVDSTECPACSASEESQHVELPHEILQLVLPHVRLPKGHIPHQVCRAWRDALSDLTCAAEWVVKGRYGRQGDWGVVFSMYAAASCSNHAAGTFMVQQLLKRHIPQPVAEPMPLEIDPADPAAQDLIRSHKAQKEEIAESNNRRKRGIQEASKGAAFAGNTQLALDMLAMLPTQPIFDQNEALKAATSGGQLATMAVLRQGLPRIWYGSLLDAAASKGQVPAMQLVLEWWDQDHPAQQQQQQQQQQEQEQGQQEQDNIEQCLGSALSQAARQGHMQTIQFLLDRGAHNCGWPLMDAVHAGQWEAARFLLPLSPAPQDNRWSWESSLKEAIQAGVVDVYQGMMELFPRVDAEHLDAAEKLPEGSEARAAIMALLLPLAAAHDTILRSAAETGNVQRVRTLMEHDPAPGTIAVALDSAIHMGYCHPDDVTPQLRQSTIDAALLLLDAGSSALVAGFDQAKAGWLLAAARWDLTQVAQRLLAAGADPNANAGAALKAAARRCNRELCQMLVQAGADPDGLRSMLVGAVHEGDMDTYQALLSAGVITPAAMAAAQACIKSRAQQLTEMEQLLQVARCTRKRGRDQ